MPSRELRGSAGSQECRISDGEAFASLSACVAAKAALCAVGSFVAATRVKKATAAFPLTFLAAAAVHLWFGPVGAAKRLALGEKNVTRAGEALGGRGRRRSGEHVRLIGIRVASKWHVEGVRLPNWRRHIRWRGKLRLRGHCAVDRGVQGLRVAPVATIGVRECAACRRAVSA